ncbi:MAG: hypothetical protein AVDCRST_MAG88-1894, partial [uncultured Thermomicrobiales bacterium]
ARGRRRTPWRDEGGAGPGAGAAGDRVRRGRAPRLPGPARRRPPRRPPRVRPAGHARAAGLAQPAPPASAGGGELARLPAAGDRDRRRDPARPPGGPALPRGWVRRASLPLPIPVRAAEAAGEPAAPLRRPRWHRRLRPGRRRQLSQWACADLHRHLRFPGLPRLHAGAPGGPAAAGTRAAARPHRPRRAIARLSRPALVPRRPSLLSARQRAPDRDSGPLPPGNESPACARPRPRGRLYGVEGL